MEREEREGVHFLMPPNAAIPLIAFVRVPEEKSIKNRLDVDVSPTDRTAADEVIGP